MIDPLNSLWPGIETPEPQWTAEMVARWPPGVFDRLREAGFLQQAKARSLIRCPNCADRHLTEVLVRQGPDGRTRTFIACLEAGRFEVSPESLRCWTIDFDRVAQALAGAMSLAAAVTPLLPGRLWRLGRTNWQDASREVVLTRGLRWPDGADVVDRIGSLRKPIVLIAGECPPAQIWRGRVPAVVSLPGIVCMEQERLVLDYPAMAASVRDADEASKQAAARPLDVRQFKCMIRQQIAADIRTRLTDDAMVFAYRQYGSVRDAALALSKATHRKVGKDRVARAVQRHGGIAAVARTTDSPSICRTVASPCRVATRATAETFSKFPPTPGVPTS
jgi:hypothetical protein